MSGRATTALLSLLLTMGCEETVTDPSARTKTADPDSKARDYNYIIDPDCSLDCEECPPTFAEHYLCDPEGLTWYCDPDPAACPDAASTEWPHWTLAALPCECIDADGNRLDTPGCEAE